MKRLLSICALICVLCCVILSLVACSGMSVSNKMYNEISEYVTDNMDTFSTTEKNKFYDYKTTGLSVGGVYYGYYYSLENELLLPDFYLGNDLEQIQNDMYEDNGGVYFGKPNNGTDWCFVKKISDKWYYYELHWA
ncbi:MAG: hypothetical protein IJ400_02700 [Clostridia bacterium]|nr:hypothetical protein [Clostridia bacterium]